jgi:hypothetical protein
MKLPNMNWLVSTESWNWFTKEFIAWEVEYLVLNPNWLFENISCLSKNSRILLYISRSYIFDNDGKTDMIMTMSDQQVTIRKCCCILLNRANNFTHQVKFPFLLLKLHRPIISLWWMAPLLHSCISYCNKTRSEIVNFICKKIS